MLGKIKRKAYRRFRKLDLRVGITTFHNLSGFTGNISGKMALKRAQRKSNVPEDMKANIEPDMIDKGVLDAGTIAGGDVSSIHDRFDEIMENNTSLLVSKHNGKTFRKGAAAWTQTDSGPVSTGFSFRKSFPEVSNLISEDVKRVLRRYYDAYCQPIGIWAKRNFHREDTGAGLGIWHLDVMTPDLLRVFVLLDDVGKENGPTQFIQTDAGETINRYGYSKYLQERHPGGMIEQEGDVKSFTAPRGSVGIMNPAKVFHRAGNPAPGETRDLIQFTFAPSSEPLPEDWIEHEEQYTHPERTGFGRLLSF